MTPRSDTAAPDRQGHELQEEIAARPDDAEPADFYDPEDLRP
jgi:hypothetical protein